MRSWAFIGSCLTVTVILFGLWLSLPHATFFSGDAGIKLVQVEGLLASGYTDVALDYPGKDLDPRAMISPYRLEPFMYRKDGKNYSVFPVAFPFLSSFPYRILGSVGLYVLPLVSAVLVLPIGFSLARLFLPRGAALFAMTSAVLATPLMFYSLTFWEHVPAVLLFMTALLLVMRGEFQPRPAILAGLTLGAAIWLRTEFIILDGILLGSGLIILRRPRPILLMVLASGLMLGSLLVFNHLVYGEWLAHMGLNLQAMESGDGASMPHQRLEIFRRTLFGLNLPQTLPQEQAGWARTMGLIGEDTRLQWVAGLCAAVILALAWPGRMKTGSGSGTRFRLWYIQLGLAAILGLVTLLYLFAMRGDRSPLVTVLASGGLFTFTPLVGLALAWPTEPPAALPRGSLIWLWGTCLTFLVLMPLLAPNDGGLRYGPRYLLPVIPLMVLLAFTTVQAWARQYRTRWPWVVALALVLVSVGIQARGIWVLREKKLLNRAFSEAVMESGVQRVAMSEWWMAYDAVPAMTERKVHLVTSTRNLVELIRRAQNLGEKRLVFCVQGVTDRLPLSPGRLGIQVESRRSVTRPSSTFFGYTVFVLDIGRTSLQGISDDRAR